MMRMRTMQRVKTFERRFELRHGNKRVTLEPGICFSGISTLPMLCALGSIIVGV